MNVKRIGFVTPELFEFVPNVGQSGAVTATLKARRGQSVKLAVSTSAEPAAATVRAAAPQALDDDGVLRTGTLATLTAGQTLYLAAFAYELTGGAGNESLLASAKITHYEGGVGCSIVEKSVAAYQVNFRLQATDADGDTVKLHYRTTPVGSPIDDYTSGTITSDASFQTQPWGKDVAADRPVSVADGGGGDRYIEAWASDVNGNKSAIVRLAIPSMATADLDAAISSFTVSGSFTGSCPTQDLIDTATWSEASGVPAAWLAKLYVCSTLGCTPPTSGPYNADATSGATRVVASGVQLGSTDDHRRNYRIRLENGYGELVDDDVFGELSDITDPC